MKKQSYFIYGLIDPRDSSLCYIGCTIRPMKERLDSGVPYAVVAEEFTLVPKSDIKRIAEKKIWTKVWDLYSIISAFKE